MQSALGSHNKQSGVVGQHSGLASCMGGNALPAMPASSKANPVASPTPQFSVELLLLSIAGSSRLMSTSLAPTDWKASLSAAACNSAAEITPTAAACSPQQMLHHCCACSFAGGSRGLMAVFRITAALADRPQLEQIMLLQPSTGSHDNEEFPAEEFPSFINWYTSNQLLSVMHPAAGLKPHGRAFKLLSPPLDLSGLSTTGRCQILLTASPAYLRPGSPAVTTDCGHLTAAYILQQMLCLVCLCSLCFLLETYVLFMQP